MCSEPAEVVFVLFREWHVCARVYARVCACVCVCVVEVGELVSGEWDRRMLVSFAIKDMISCFSGMFPW